MLWLSEILLQGHDLESFAALEQVITARAGDGEMFFHRSRIHRKTGKIASRRPFQRHRKTGDGSGFCRVRSICSGVMTAKRSLNS